ncbi:hypothetical protein F511_36757 [Dorcoceras hygrometricum]|uniref:Uncharacterized protein n=1 Tax=Dorcoceras hygrometricum TaxID=472368 RepID=A0A2Z7D2Y0_9LAMI|nr:hypothetical protein F511_36757 [Dorcoceras hygrometricum]
MWNHGCSQCPSHAAPVACNLIAQPNWCLSCLLGGGSYPSEPQGNDTNRSGESRIREPVDTSINLFSKFSMLIFNPSSWLKQQARCPNPSSRPIARGHQLRSKTRESYGSAKHLRESTQIHAQTDHDVNLKGYAQADVSHQHRPIPVICSLSSGLPEHLQADSSLHSHGKS